jgi:hypothetical protein
MASTISLSLKYSETVDLNKTELRFECVTGPIKLALRFTPQRVSYIPHLNPKPILKGKFFRLGHLGSQPHTEGVTKPQQWWCVCVVGGQARARRLWGRGGAPVLVSTGLDCPLHREARTSARPPACRHSKRRCARPPRYGTTRFCLRGAAAGR